MHSIAGMNPIALGVAAFDEFLFSKIIEYISIIPYPILAESG